MDNGPQLDSVASLHLHCVGLLGDGGLSTLAERLRELDEISTSVPPAKRSLAIQKPTLIISTQSSILFEDFAGGTNTSPGCSSRWTASGYFARTVIQK